ncbi:MAG: hypothetical protein EOM77_02045 [Bacteroidia bacterium]|nr:hypothetical protein [Bacteroidia bacterium]
MDVNRKKVLSLVFATILFLGLSSRNAIPKNISIDFLSFKINVIERHAKLLKINKLGKEQEAFAIPSILDVCYFQEKRCALWDNQVPTSETKILAFHAKWT